MHMNLKYAPHITALVALVLVGVLSSQVRALRPLERQVRRMRGFPHTGQWFPTTQLVSSKGDSLVIGETKSGRAQVLIMFNYQCPYCRASLPAWRELSDSLMRDPTGRVDVVWISPSLGDSTAAYVTEHGLHSYRVAKFLDMKMPMVMKTRTVPQTIVLDRLGRVAFVHTEALTERSTLDSIYSATALALAADSLRAVATTPPR